MTAKQRHGKFAPDGSEYVTLTDGSGNLGSQVSEQVKTPLGHSQVTSLSSAAGVGSIPGGATHALIEAETQSVRWRDDGTNPTTSVGHVLPAGSSIWYAGSLSAIKFIEVAASAKLNISFY